MLAVVAGSGMANFTTCAPRLGPSHSIAAIIAS
jgi:hypothetical protein